MSIKNRLILSLVRLLKPKIPSSFTKRHFLIVSTTGLGDTLWGTPGIKALRASFPNAKISVLTSPIGSEVLGHNPYIDELIVMRDPVFASLPRLYFQLKRQHISDVLLFHTSQRSLLPLTAILGARRIIGTIGINKGLDELLTDPLEHMKMHEIQRRLQIVHQAGAHLGDPSLEIFLKPKEEQIAQDYLNQLNIPPHTALICIHPGAKDLFKQWAPSHFISLGKKLTERIKCQLFITGTASEKTLVTKIARQIPGAIPVTHLKLRPFAAFVKHMSLVIANDTGPMHVAFAMKTPTVALFTPTDPELCGPYFAHQAHIIYKKKTCTPCLRKQCREPFCLLQIGVDTVFNTSLQLITKHQD